LDGRNVSAADVLAAARAMGGPAWVVEMKLGRLG